MIQEYFNSRWTPGVMVDVGAHHGESLVPYWGRGWSIQAFEPDPANRALLEKNIPVDRIRLHTCAVSDREAEGVSFFASEESDGISSLSAFRPTHRETDKVAVRTLARVLAEEGVSRVDFLKIDTEGHDLFVLKGFPWERMKPEVILCEFEDSKTVPLGYDYRAMGDYLVERGYQVFLSEWAPIVRYGVQHTWRSFRPYPCALEDPAGWGNFVAVRAGADAAPLLAYAVRHRRS